MKSIIIGFIAICLAGIAFCSDDIGKDIIDSAINEYDRSNNQIRISTSDSHSGDVVLGVGAIIGIAIGGIVFLVLCCVCICRCCCGCCRRDATYVQTTVVTPAAAPTHAYINIGQFPTAPAAQPYPPNPAYRHQQQQPAYAPLQEDPPPQYFAK